MRELATHVYIGRKKCGCCVAVVTDDGDRNTAKDVASFIRGGYAVERISFEDYRSRPDVLPLGCQCSKKPVQMLLGHA